MESKNGDVVGAKIKLDISEAKAQLNELEEQADRILAKAREAKELMK